MIRLEKQALLVICGLPLGGLLAWLIAGLGWTGALFEFVAIGAAVVAVRFLVSRQSADAPFRTLAEVAVPSASTGTNFLLSSDVRWVAAGSLSGLQSNVADIAQAALLERARVLSARWRPDLDGSAQYELAARLSERELDESRQVLVWAENVRVELSEADRGHLARMVEAERQIDLWEITVAKEQRVRSYLKDDALKTPDDALVWWLSRHDAEVERAVDLSAVLAKLSDLAAGRTNSAADSAVGQRLAEALAAVDPSTRPSLASEFGDVLRVQGFEKDADILCRAHGVQDLDAQVIDIGQGGRPPAAEG